MFQWTIETFISWNQILIIPSFLISVSDLNNAFTEEFEEENIDRASVSVFLSIGHEVNILNVGDDGQ